MPPRLRVATAAALSLGLGLVALQAMPSNAAPAPATAGATTQRAPEMAQLDFMIGRWSCVNTVSVPGQEPTSNTLITTIRPILDGAYIEWDSVQQVRPGATIQLKARWVAGWHAPTAQFTAFYYDNRGNHGEESSPGTQGGHIAFTGSILTGSATPSTIRDDFTSAGRDDFVDSSSVQVGGTWVSAASSHCKRLR